jgi:hypothetical protein
VNAADANWQELIRPYRHAETVDLDLYGQRDELRYSLRSLAVNAPWIRTIYIFSNCPPPPWFQSGDRYRWINHADVIKPETLPPFNSHAIETFLHRMPGIAEQFLYLNDDVFVSAPTRKNHFFTGDGRSVANMEPYGTVIYHQSLVAGNAAADYQHAAVNGAHLISQRFGTFPTHLHQDVPFALRKSILEEIEREFPVELLKTRSNRFRSFDDLSTVSFFYPHFAEATGRAIRSTTDCVIANPANLGKINAAPPKKYKFLCLNDGKGSAMDESYSAFKDTFLSSRFPLRAPCEK